MVQIETTLKIKQTFKRYNLVSYLRRWKKNIR